MDQLIIPSLIFFFILITCLLDIIQIVEGEILSWSVVGLKGLIYKYSSINKFLEVEVLVKKTLQKSNGLISGFNAMWYQWRVKICRRVF